MANVVVWPSEMATLRIDEPSATNRKPPSLAICRGSRKRAPAAAPSTEPFSA